MAGCSENAIAAVEAATQAHIKQRNPARFNLLASEGGEVTAVEARREEMVVGSHEGCAEKLHLLMASRFPCCSNREIKKRRRRKKIGFLTLSTKLRCENQRISLTTLGCFEEH